MPFDVKRSTMFFLYVGTLLRLLRYALCYPLWGDESMFAANLIDRPWSDVAKPLDYWQVAPVGFIAGELAVVKTLGFSEYTLRLVPLLAGIASLWSFWWLARRWLTDQATFFAVAFLAVAFQPICMSAEVKSYSLDLLLAVWIFGCGLEWMSAHERPEPQDQARRWRWPAIAAILLPAAVWFSFPSVFVAGGMVVSVLLHSLRCKRYADAVLVCVVGVLLCGSFALSLRISSDSQIETHGQYMRDYWRDWFPPGLDRWTTWPAWLFKTHTNSTFAYPVGGKLGLSLPMTLASLYGLVVLYRTRPNQVILIATVFGLGIVAAAVRKYPYGVPRLSQHLAPLICWSAAIGVEAACQRLHDLRPHWRTSLAQLSQRVGIACTAVAIATAIAVCAWPYTNRFDQDHRSFARWFWAHVDDKPVISMVFDANSRIVMAEDASYRCAERMYRRSARPSQASQEGDEVNCVIFESRGRPWNQSAYEQWWREIENRYEILSRDEFATSAINPGTLDRYTVVRLRTKPGSSDEGVIVAGHTESIRR